MHQIMSPHQMLLLFIMFFTTIPITDATVTKKLGEPLLVPQEPDTAGGIKCGSCPCVNPCAQVLPPPPPPTPPEPITYCTPVAPPPPRFVYVTAGPGTVYQSTDPYDRWVYNDAGQMNAVTWSSLLSLGFGVLELMLMIW